VTLTTLNQSLPQILKNIDSITENLRQSVHSVRATVEEAINRSLPSILENVDRLTSTVGRAVEVVKGRVEDLSQGVERFRGGLVKFDDHLKDSGRSRISHGLVSFAGLVKRVRTALESFKPWEILTAIPQHKPTQFREDNMSEKDDFAKGIITGALIGGLAGVVVGILIAPKSGSETRQEIAEKAKDFADKVQDEYDVLYDKARRSTDTLIHRLHEM
jgi:hypothetical protein